MTDSASSIKAEKPLGEKIREAGSHTLIYGFGAAVQTMLGFVLIPLYTRYYTPEIYGVLSLVVLCGTLAGVVFYLGASSALSRSYYDYTDEAERKKVSTTSLLLILLGAVTQVLLGFLLRDRLSLQLFGSTKYALHISLALVSSALSFTNNLFYLILRFERKSKQVILINILALVSGASLIVWMLTGLKMGVMAPILGEAINQLLIFGILFYVTRRSFTWGYSRREIGIQLHYGIPNVLSGLLLYLMTSTDRLMINKWLSLGEVGIYALGCKIGMAIQPLFINPFSQIWAPMRMQYRQDGDFWELYKVILTYYFAIGLFFTAAVSLFARDILVMFSGRAEYHVAYQIVPPIMVAYLVYGAINIVDFGIALTRKVIYHVYAFGAALLVNAGLNWILLPRYGYRASAVVLLLTFLILTAIVFQVSQRLYRIKYEGRRLLALAGSSLAIVVIGLQPTFPVGWSSAAYKACLLACLLAGWYWLLLTSKEKSQLTSLARPVLLVVIR
ncbi:MAG: oligosaccharide flippase family protein [Opitutaceae bacterium]|nr:oligosaccharide flippase family protein [Opitutaceae bacterium]